MFGVEVFTLPFSEEVRGIDTQEVKDFLSERELLSFSDHFFVHQGVPYLLLVVSFRERSSSPKGSRAKGREEKKDWKRGLTEEEKSLYEVLRSWRRERAQRESVPLFVILTNKQLVEIVTSRPTSKTDLERIQGVGPITSDKYGEEILACLAKYNDLESAPEND